MLGIHGTKTKIEGRNNIRFFLRFPNLYLWHVKFKIINFDFFIFLVYKFIYVFRQVDNGTTGNKKKSKRNDTLKVIKINSSKLFTPFQCLNPMITCIILIHYYLGVCFFFFFFFSVVVAASSLKKKSSFLHFFGQWIIVQDFINKICNSCSFILIFRFVPPNSSLSFHSRHRATLEWWGIDFRYYYYYRLSSSLSMATWNMLNCKSFTTFGEIGTEWKQRCRSSNQYQIN